MSVDSRIALKIILASLRGNQYDFEYFVNVFLLPDILDLIWKDLGITVHTRRKNLFSQDVLSLSILGVSEHQSISFAVKKPRNFHCLCIQLAT